jgi:hypothetical protein
VKNEQEKEKEERHENDAYTPYECALDEVVQ